MVVLRPDDEIDDRRAGDDLLALRLRDAAGDRDLDILADGASGLLHLAHPAKLGIDLLGGLFANMAGVEDHKIGILHLRRLDIAFGRERIGHAGRVIDIHLAAIAFDEDPLGTFGCGSRAAAFFGEMAAIHGSAHSGF